MNIYQHIPELISPAIVLGILAFAVKFFGKTIADQKPYADDRDWEIQLQGIFFLVLNIVPAGFVAFFLSSYLGAFGTSFLLRATCVLALIFWISLVSIVHTQNIYGLSLIIKPEQKISFKEKLLEEFKKYKNVEQFSQEILEVLALFWRKAKSLVVGRNVPRFIISIFFIWALMAEFQQYVSQEFRFAGLMYLVSMTTMVFIGFFVLAYNKSLSLYKNLPTVDIYPVGKTKPFQNVTLLKSTENYVRFLVNKDELVIMNKDQVQRIVSLRSKNPE